MWPVFNIWKSSSLILEKSLTIPFRFSPLQALVKGKGTERQCYHTACKRLKLQSWVRTKVGFPDGWIHSSGPWWHQQSMQLLPLLLREMELSVLSWLLSLDLPHSACSRAAGWCSCWWGCGLAHPAFHQPGFPSGNVGFCCPHTLLWPWDYHLMAEPNHRVSTSLWPQHTAAERHFCITFSSSMPSLIAEARNDGIWMATVMLGV